MRYNQVSTRVEKNAIHIFSNRPDISYVVNRLVTRTSRATEWDYLRLIRVAKYLACTKELGFVIRRGTLTGEKHHARSGVL